MAIRLILAAAMLGVVFLASARGRAAGPPARILDDDLPGLDRAFAAELRQLAAAGGYDAQPITARELARDGALKDVELLILANGRSVPVEAMEAVQAHLKRGRKLLVLGLPLWEGLVSDYGGRWLTRADYEKALAAVRPEHKIISFDGEDLTKWTRSAGAQDRDVKWEIADGALHCTVGELDSWANVGRAVENAFPDGKSITCFRARGVGNTDQLAIEFVEGDGSRWIATVPITNEWKDYSIPVEAFVAWQPPRGRGGEADHLHPERVARFAVGLALTHTEVGRGRHEFYFADLASATRPFGQVRGMPDIPRIEGLCPGYKFYPVTTDTILSNGAQAFTPIDKLAGPRGLLAFHPRPGGAGYNKKRPWRWQPILEARSPEGDYRGAVGVRVINLEGAYRGSAFVAFTPVEPAFYRQAPIRKLLGEAVADLKRGTWLAEGGANYYTLFDDQPATLGARITGDASANVRIAVLPPHGKPVFAHEGPAGEFNWKPPRDWPAEGYTVTCELLDGGKVIDRLEHELNVWRPPAEKHFITTKDGHFVLHGETWKAHGVNYMPASGIGLDHGEMFEHYLSSMSYDPVIFQRDLERMKNMGLNSVSVFIYAQWTEAQNLLDLLRRCRDLDLRVNLSIRPGQAMDFHADGVRKSIEYYHLKENDTVFAYDLGWEVSHYDRGYQQKKYRPAWRDWVEKRYGSLAAAEKKWSFAAARAPDGKLDVPESRQLIADGPWRAMVIDYRRFLDEITDAAYVAVRDFIRTLDTNHAVSFRMTIAGDPTAETEHQLPFDFWSLRRGVDIWEPEAYGRISDQWERVRPGIFTAAYARLCDPAKPIFWAEMGVSNWDLVRMEVSQKRLDFQARYFELFYRVLGESGADGIFYWWYPGGYRVGERSDFGILNPDGTDRPATKVIRRLGPTYLAAPFPPPPDTLIAVDRETDARGLHGLYEAVKDEYWRAFEAGKHPALRWSRQPGSAAD